MIREGMGGGGFGLRVRDRISWPRGFRPTPRPIRCYAWPRCFWRLCHRWVVALPIATTRVVAGRGGDLADDAGRRMLLRRTLGDGTAAAFILVATAFLAVTLLGWRGIAHGHAPTSGRVSLPSADQRPGPRGRCAPGLPHCGQAARVGSERHGLAVHHT